MNEMQGAARTSLDMPFYSISFCLIVVPPLMRYLGVPHQAVVSLCNLSYSATPPLGEWQKEALGQLHWQEMWQNTLSY